MGNELCARLRRARAFSRLWGKKVATAIIILHQCGLVMNISCPWWWSAVPRPSQSGRAVPHSLAANKAAGARTQRICGQ